LAIADLRLKTKAAGEIRRLFYFQNNRSKSTEVNEENKDVF